MTSGVDVYTARGAAGVIYLKKKKESHDMSWKTWRVLNYAEQLTYSSRDAHNCAGAEQMRPDAENTNGPGEEEPDYRLIFIIRKSEHLIRWRHIVGRHRRGRHQIIMKSG